MASLATDKGAVCERKGRGRRRTKPAPTAVQKTQGMRLKHRMKKVLQKEEEKEEEKEEKKAGSGEPGQAGALGQAWGLWKCEVSRVS